MFLDERSHTLLGFLRESKSYVEINEICEKFKISRRTFYYDLQKINFWLKKNNFSEVERIRGMGFILKQETKDKLPQKMFNISKYEYEYTKKERLEYEIIAFLMNTKGFYLNDLVKLLRVSRNTILSDIKKVKIKLKVYELDLAFDYKKGYFILGSETNQRRILINYLASINLFDFKKIFEKLVIKEESLENLFEQMLKQEELKIIYKILLECEKHFGFEFTKDSLDHLSIHLLIFIKRFTKGKTIEIDPVEQSVLKTTREYKASIFIKNLIEKEFLIEFPKEEIAYITTHLLGLKMNHFSPKEALDDEDHKIKNIINLMVDDFQRYACLEFQEKNLLKENLFIHLKPAYYRIKYGLDVENPISETIKTKYKEIFILTKKVIFHLENALSKKVKDNEIAFIAMHFGGWMKRQGAVAAKRKKAIIVCDNGIGTSQILKNQIEALLFDVDIVATISKREYEKINITADFVISTVEFKSKKHKVFCVKAILTKAEKQMLLNFTQEKQNNYSEKNIQLESIIQIIKKHSNIKNEEDLKNELKLYLTKLQMDYGKDSRPMLKDLIVDDHIQLLKEVANWKEAIEIASMPLVKNEFITRDYIKAMIENVEKFGPYIVIAPKVAIPHAKVEQGVFKLGMSFLKLEKPVSFSDDEDQDVQLMIVLAAIDNQTHLRALAQLSTLLSQEGNIDKIIKMQSKKEVLSILEKYSNDEE